MAKIDVKGVIVADDEQWIYDWYGIKAISPGMVNKVLDSVQEGEEVEVFINSGGGSVSAGSEIYASLKDHSSPVTAKIMGFAASAASIIAMGADNLLMAPTGQIMIHNVSGQIRGDHNTMAHTAEVLKVMDEGIANAYMIKTGMSREELLDLMNKETWINAHTAKEMKFIDEIMFANDNFKNGIELNSQGVIPQEVINKMKNERENFIKPREISPEKIENNSIKIAKAKLDLALFL